MAQRWASYLIYEAVHCTAKTQYRKFKTSIPRKGTARPQSQFLHLCFCERFIYSHHRSACSAAGKQVDRSWEYIDRSQTHECGNWGWFLFRGIHNSKHCPTVAHLAGIFSGIRFLCQADGQTASIRAHFYLTSCWNLVNLHSVFEDCLNVVFYAWEGLCV